MKRTRRSGVTVAELIIYTVIFAMVMLMIMYAFLYMGKTQSGMKRLDIFHNLRSGSVNIANAFSYSTKVLYPPEDGAFHPVLVFLDEFNQIKAMFLEKDTQRLILLDYAEAKKGGRNGLTMLSPNVINFNVKRKDKNFVSYKLKLRDEKGFEFVLSNSIHIRCDFQ